MPRLVGQAAMAVMVVLAAPWACAATTAASPLPGPAFPRYASPAAVTAACERHLKTARALLRQMERAPADARWLARFDAFSGRIEDLSSPVLLLPSVHPDKAFREAAEACELRWNDFNSTRGQNAALFRAVQRLSGGDAIDRELRRKLLEDFEDAGVSLPGAQRARAKQLNDRIAELGTQFDRNVRDDNVQVAFSVAELKGVPEAVWREARRDDAGRVLLGIDYPVYFPVLQTAEFEATRERMWRAKVNQGGERNLALLAEIATLRREYAALFGARSWAEFSLRRRMAGTPARAEGFLAEVKAAVEARERGEIDELKNAKAAHLGVARDAVRVERWDVPFYTERLKRAKFGVDEEAFRPYFPPEESLQFCLRLIERLMGVRYQRVPGVAPWHPEVQSYRVSDAATGKPLATMWVDLYPREGKYNHAAVWSMRSSSALTGRAAQAALIVNFDRRGLTLDELETLLHELGHAVHNNLSATRYALQAGTSTQQDFVEAPSQMLEDWVFDPQVLKVFAEVCPTCKPVPEAMVRQAKAARDYGKGIRESRQHLYASYDLATYGREARDPMALWAAMEGATPLGHPPDSRFPASFSHVATNYAAGYYGYLWSLVVAMDMRTAFEGRRLDPAVGLRYRNTVLANGGQRPPDELVKAFLGREFSPKAFFDDLKK